MNLRNKYLLTTLRVILGLFFIMSGAGGFYGAMNGWAGIPTEMLPNVQALWAMGIFQLVKGTELIAGLMLVVGFRPALAAIFLAPICIGATTMNLLNSPQYIWSALFVTVLNAYLGYAYWDKYKALFQK